MIIVTRQVALYEPRQQLSPQGSADRPAYALYTPSLDADIQVMSASRRAMAGIEIGRSAYRLFLGDLDAIPEEMADSAVGWVVEDLGTSRWYRLTSPLEIYDAGGITDHAEGIMERLDEEPPMVS